MKLNRFHVISTISLIMAATAIPANAQNRYEPWQNPDGSQQSAGQLEELINKLNGLIDTAERDRAANPQFLRDLRDLTSQYHAGGYHRAWPAVLLDDDFSDGDYQHNPVWRVSGGRYWIEKSYGLRSSLSQSNQNQQSTDSNSHDNRDAAAQILGSILNQALGGGRNQSQQNQTNTSSQSHLATISTDTPISNAFSIRLEMTSWKNQGQFFMGPYQGARRDAGYRLVYRVGQVPSVQILRVSSRGTVVIGSYHQPLKLEDQKPHTINWTRDKAGAMTVEIDDRELIRVTDQGFRDRFNGFKIANGGGDYIVRRVTIQGSR